MDLVLMEIGGRTIWLGRRKAVILPGKKGSRILKIERNVWRKMILCQSLYHEYPPARAKEAADPFPAAVLADMIRVYGLRGYEIVLVIGDENLILKQIALPTRNYKEACQSIAWSGMLLDSSEEYLFDAVLVRKDARSNEYEWLAAAYKRGCIEAAAAACRREGAVLTRVDILPALIKEFCPAYEGTLTMCDNEEVYSIVLSAASVEAYACRAANEGTPPDEAAVLLRSCGDGKQVKKAEKLGLTGMDMVLAVRIQA